MKYAKKNYICCNIWNCFTDYIFYILLTSIGHSQDKSVKRVASSVWQNAFKEKPQSEIRFICLLNIFLKEH